MINRISRLIACMRQISVTNICLARVYTCRNFFILAQSNKKYNIFLTRTFTEKLVFSKRVYYNSLIGGAWCSGSTRASDSLSVGSIPIAPAKKRTKQSLRSFFIQSEGLVCNQRACALYGIATKSRMASREARIKSRSPSD